MVYIEFKNGNLIITENTVKVENDKLYLKFEVFNFSDVNKIMVDGTITYDVNKKSNNLNERM